MTEKTEEIGRGDIKAVGDVVSNILSNESNVDITVNTVIVFLLFCCCYFC